MSQATVFIPSAHDVRALRELSVLQRLALLTVMNAVKRHLGLADDAFCELTLTTPPADKIDCCGITFEVTLTASWSVCTDVTLSRNGSHAPNAKYYTTVCIVTWRPHLDCDPRYPSAWHYETISPELVAPHDSA